MTEKNVEKKDETDTKEEENLLLGLFGFTSQRTDELMNKYYEQANSKSGKDSKLQMHHVLKMIGDDKDATEQEKIVVCFMLGLNTARKKEHKDDDKKEEGDIDADKPHS